MGLWKNKLNPIYNRQQKNEQEQQAWSDSEAKAKGLLADVKGIADADRAEYDALQKKQIEDANALKARSTSMQGGGRKGLMYQGNAQGVA